MQVLISGRSARGGKGKNTRDWPVAKTVVDWLKFHKAWSIWGHGASGVNRGVTQVW